jgi:hypothetical protein
VRWNGAMALAVLTGTTMPTPMKAAAIGTRNIARSPGHQRLADPFSATSHGVAKHYVIPGSGLPHHHAASFWSANRCILFARHQTACETGGFE